MLRFASALLCFSWGALALRDGTAAGLDEEAPTAARAETGQPPTLPPHGSSPAEKKPTPTARTQTGASPAKNGPPPTAARTQTGQPLPLPPSHAEKDPTPTAARTRTGQPPTLPPHGSSPAEKEPPPTAARTQTGQPLPVPSSHAEKVPTPTAAASKPQLSSAPAAAASTQSDPTRSRTPSGDEVRPTRSEPARPRASLPITPVQTQPADFELQVAKARSMGAKPTSAAPALRKAASESDLRAHPACASSDQDGFYICNCDRGRLFWSKRSAFTKLLGDYREFPESEADFKMGTNDTMEAFMLRVASEMCATDSGGYCLYLDFCDEEVRRMNFVYKATRSQGARWTKEHAEAVQRKLQEAVEKSHVFLWTSENEKTYCFDFQIGSFFCEVEFNAAILSASYNDPLELHEVDLDPLLRQITHVSFPFLPMIDILRRALSAAPFDVKTFYGRHAQIRAPSHTNDGNLEADFSAFTERPAAGFGLDPPQPSTPAFSFNPPPRQERPAAAH